MQHRLVGEKPLEFGHIPATLEAGDVDSSQAEGIVGTSFGDHGQERWPAQP